MLSDLPILQTMIADSMPPPGWYSDPWGLAPYRWWSGSSWEAQVWPQPGPLHHGRRGWGLALVVTAGILLSWAGMWLAMLPLLLINDADNGRFGHDFRSLWVPEFLPAVITAVVCLVMVQAVQRRAVGMRLLALPVALLVITIVADTVAIALHTS